MNAHEERLAIEKAQCGDRVALGLLWDALSPKLFGYLVNILNNKETAEDIFQTVWIHAVAGLPNFNYRGRPFSAWLFAIAHNECRQYWRKQQREVPLEPAIHDISDRTGNIEDSILAQQIIVKLSEDDQDLLRLRYIADLPLQNIAQLMKLNFVTVRVRVHRALARARMQAVAIRSHV